MPFPLIGWVAVAVGTAVVAAIASSDDSSSSSSSSSSQRREIEEENQRRRQQQEAAQAAQRKAEQLAYAEHKASELINRFKLEGISKQTLVQLALNKSLSFDTQLNAAFNKARPTQALAQKINQQAQKLDELTRLSNML